METSQVGFTGHAAGTAAATSVMFAEDAGKTVSGVGAVRVINPRTDPRWAEFVQRHPRASLFHSPAWLSALAQTYGYDSLAWTTAREGTSLSNGLVFCAVESWLTGRRLVSLPFSDHCEPLIDQEEDAAAFAVALGNALQEGRWRYIELRPKTGFALTTAAYHATASYHFHQVDLEPSLDDLFRAFHKDSVQRKILRAEREGLRYEEGSSDEMLDRFYHLFNQMRARHSAPSPPLEWFKNLRQCFGDAFRIRLAYKDSQAIAVMITIRHKDTLVYKYGASDLKFNRFGGVHLLYWYSVQDAKNAGLRWFDLGRTDFGQDGLVTFKNRWGAARSVLTYTRYTRTQSSARHSDWPRLTRVAKTVLSHLHPRVVSAVGDILYKHVG